MFAWTGSLWQFLLKLDQREGCCTAPETRILSFLVGWSVESALDASFHCPSVAATKMKQKNVDTSHSSTNKTG